MSTRVHSPVQPTHVVALQDESEAYPCARRMTPSDVPTDDMPQQLCTEAMG
jgi:hypothetical protein